MTKLKAQRLAKKARKAIKSKGWRVDIWENSGWHVAFRKGGMNLYVSENYWSPTITYSTLFSLDGSSSGEIFWSTGNFQSSDPNRVIEYQLKIAKAFVRKCQRAINRVK